MEWAWFSVFQFILKAELRIHLPPLAYSITKYNVFSVSITSNNFTARKMNEREIAARSKSTAQPKNYTDEASIIYGQW